ncbi:sodium/proline symporter [bacterium]|nr:sodium/proline symporter [bacterium]
MKTPKGILRIMVSSLIAFALYSIAVLGIGFWATRLPQKTAEEIHLGNREHGAWTSALSASASTESGFVLLGMVGMGYTQGVSCFWMVAAGLLGYFLNWYVLAPKLRRKSEAMKAITIPEIIASATGSTSVSRLASALAAVFAIVFLLAYVSAQFSAAGKALSSQFPISYSAGVLAAAGLIVFYAVLGGFRAVSWTDNLQATMMVLSLIVLPVVVLFKIGGIPGLVSSLEAKGAHLVSLTGGAADLKGKLLLILPWLMIGLAYPGQPHGLARLMAAKDERVLRLAPVIAMIWLVIVYTGAITLGMAARAGFENLHSIAADPETALPVLAVAHMPGILAGMTLAAIIAAISSTADSQLLSAATTVIRDIRAALRLPPLKNELLVTRVTIFLLAVLSTYFAMRQTHVVFKFVLYAFFGLGASLGPVILYCILWKNPQPLPSLLAVIVGGVSIFLVQRFTLHFLISFCTAILVIIISHGILRWLSLKSENAAGYP